MGNMRVPCVKSTIAEVHAMVPLALSHNTLQESSSLSRIFQHTYKLWCKAGVSPRASEPWMPSALIWSPSPPNLWLQFKKKYCVSSLFEWWVSVY